MQDASFGDGRNNLGYSLVSEDGTCVVRPTAISKRTCKRPRRFELPSERKDPGMEKKKKNQKKVVNSCNFTGICLIYVKFIV